MAKTRTSSEVKQRWMAANYKKYVVSLRFDTDSKLIQFIEDNKDTIGTTEIFREGIKALMEKSE